MKKIPLIDLDNQYNNIKKNVLYRIEKVLDSGQYIMGNEVVEVEVKLAEYTGRKYCLTCSSGTDALVMALMAMDVGPGDEIITTPFTFIATAEAICLVGAKPIFVDIDPSTFNINPEKIEEYLSEYETSSVKGIISVDLFGLPCDYSTLEKICHKNDLFLIEDAAQGMGGAIGKEKNGSFGTISTTSFYPAKPLGCYGDGGAVFTDDDSLHEMLCQIRVHGESERYISERIGLNARFDTVQAAILLEKLGIFEQELIKRRTVADLYFKHLGELNLIIQHIPDGFSSGWAQFSILTDSNDQRESIAKKLNKENVGYGIYYQTPLHLQPAFTQLNYQKGDFPIAEDFSQRIISLPMHPFLSEDEIINISEVIAEILLLNLGI